jgi:hypothetical protein
MLHPNGTGSGCGRVNIVRSANAGLAGMLPDGMVVVELKRIVTVCSSEAAP